MKNIPKIHFRGFSEEWEEKELGEEFDVRDGTHDSPKYIENGYPLITSKNLCANGKIDFNNINYISEEDFNFINKRSKVDIGDILFGMIGTIGNPVIVEKEGFAIKNVALIKSQNQSNKFLFYYLFSNFIKEQFFIKNTGGTQKFIALNVIRKLIFKFPPIQEQQKIGKLFETIDKLILTQEKKHKQLENIKKSFLEKLFPQDDKNIPKIRFRGFSEEWEERKIKNIFDDITRGYVLSKNKISNKQTTKFKYPVYSSQTLNNGLLGYYSEYLYENAITWTTDGANAGDVKYRKEKFYCTNVSGVLISKKGFSNQCIAEILNTQTKKYVSYVGNPKLMNNVMSEIIINIPPLILEQQKIGIFFQKLDKLLELNQQKITKLKQIKKSLLNKMLI